MKFHIPAWPSFFLNSLSSMRKDRFLCDVTIITKENEELLAHSVVLAIGSPVLRKTIRQQSKRQGKISGVRLKSTFSTDVWLTILKYLYSGTFEGQSELHDEFMELIKMLAIPLVQSMITQYEKTNKNVKQEEVTVVENNANSVTTPFSESEPEEPIIKAECNVNLRHEASPESKDISQLRATRKRAQVDDVTYTETDKVTCSQTDDVTFSQVDNVDIGCPVIVHQSSSHTVYESCFQEPVSKKRKYLDEGTSDKIQQTEDSVEQPFNQLSSPIEDIPLPNEDSMRDSVDICSVNISEKVSEDAQRNTVPNLITLAKHNNRKCSEIESVHSNILSNNESSTTAVYDVAKDGNRTENEMCQDEFIPAVSKAEPMTYRQFSCDSESSLQDIQCKLSHCSDSLDVCPKLLDDYSIASNQIIAASNLTHDTKQEQGSSRTIMKCQSDAGDVSSFIENKQDIRDEIYDSQQRHNDKNDVCHDVSIDRALRESSSLTETGKEVSFCDPCTESTESMCIASNTYLSGKEMKSVNICEVNNADVAISMEGSDTVESNEHEHTSLTDYGDIDLEIMKHDKADSMCDESSQNSLNDLENTDLKTCDDLNTVENLNSIVKPAKYLPDTISESNIDIKLEGQSEEKHTVPDDNSESNIGIDQVDISHNKNTVPDNKSDSNMSIVPDGISKSAIALAENNSESIIDKDKSQSTNIVHAPNSQFKPAKSMQSITVSEAVSKDSIRIIVVGGKGTITPKVDALKFQRLLKERRDLGKNTALPNDVKFKIISPVKLKQSDDTEKVVHSEKSANISKENSLSPEENSQTRFHNPSIVDSSTNTKDAEALSETKSESSSNICDNKGSPNHVMETEIQTGRQRKCRSERKRKDQEKPQGAKFMCELCNNLEFPSNAALLKHQQLHVLKAESESESDKTVKPGESKPKVPAKSYFCPQCNKAFGTLDGLVAHSYLHGKKQFKCELCDKSFQTPRYLKKHMQSMHSDEGDTMPIRFQCTYCQKLFKAKSALRAHIRFEHEKQGQMNVCTICGRGFRFPVLLRQHMDWHKGTTPFQCTVCPKAFLKKGQLQMHMITHSQSRDHKCHVCARAFKHASTLREHLLSQHGGDGDDNTCTMKEDEHTCSTCQQVFKQRRNLLAHVRTVHLQQRDHHCHVCNKSYSRRSLLMDHFKTNMHLKQAAQGARLNEGGVVGTNSAQMVINELPKMNQSGDVSHVTQSGVTQLQGISLVGGNGELQNVSQIQGVNHFTPQTVPTLPVLAQTDSSQLASQKLLNIVNASTVLDQNNEMKQCETSVKHREVAEIMSALNQPQLCVSRATSERGNDNSQVKGASQLLETFGKLSQQVNPTISNETVQNRVSTINAQSNNVNSNGKFVSPEATKQTVILPSTPLRHNNETGSKLSIDLSDWSVLNTLMKTPDDKQTALIKSQMALPPSQTTSEQFQTTLAQSQMTSAPSQMILPQFQATLVQTRIISAQSQITSIPTVTQMPTLVQQNPSVYALVPIQNNVDSSNQASTSTLNTASVFAGNNNVSGDAKELGNGKRTKNTRVRKRGTKKPKKQHDDVPIPITAAPAPNSTVPIHSNVAGGPIVNVNVETPVVQICTEGSQLSSLNNTQLIPADLCVPSSKTQVTNAGIQVSNTSLIESQVNISNKQIQSACDLIPQTNIQNNSTTYVPIDQQLSYIVANSPIPKIPNHLTSSVDISTNVFQTNQSTTSFPNNQSTSTFQIDQSTPQLKTPPRIGLAPNTPPSIPLSSFVTPPKGTYTLQGGKMPQITQSMHRTPTKEASLAPTAIFQSPPQTNTQSNTGHLVLFRTPTSAESSMLGPHIVFHTPSPPGGEIHMETPEPSARMQGGAPKADDGKLHTPVHKP